VGHPLGKTKETAEAEARVEKELKEKVDQVISEGLIASSEGTA
jgi:hypothetical protein